MLTRACLAAALIALSSRACLDQAWAGSEPAEPSLPRIQVPQQATPILPLREVRIGQRGYGLTVFSGTKIEPFPVEVVSVMTDFEPQRGAVWIMCDDPRLNLSGPVQGMSGSPIYLWDEGEAQELGRGGRLIGAFAFGFGLSKVCLAGVQPIEQMRATAERARLGHDKAEKALGKGPGPDAILSRMVAMADESGHRTLAAAQLRAMRDLAAGLPGAKVSLARSSMPSAPQGYAGQVQPLALPIAVNDGRIAAWMSPLLGPLGVSVLSAPGGAAVAGRPPLEVDADEVRLEPGSVLSVPLGWGDMDLSASGTVTEVLPDGRVLGFGHAMFGQGSLGIPMATGYVHTVVPLVTTSFKLSGSLRMAGSLVHDESSGVVGTSQTTFHAAPLTVDVRWDDQPVRTYRYHVAHHREYTPLIATIASLQSLFAQQFLPAEHTVRLGVILQLSGGRKLEFSSVGAGTGPQSLVYGLIPPLATLLQNPFEPLRLEAAQITIHVVPTLNATTLVDGRIDRVEVAPGQTLGVALRVQPYGKAVTTQTLKVPIPQDLPDGDYELVVCDGTNYLGRVMASKPHRMTIRSLDDLEQSLREVLSVDSTSVYALLQLPQQGLAYGRTELPRLPSSRRVVVQAPTTTAVLPYAQWQEVRVPMDSVTSGEVSFTVSVRRPFQAR